MSKLSIAILCGGRSRRFEDKNKLLFQINNESLLEIVYRKFSSCSDDVFFQGCILAKNRHEQQRLDHHAMQVYSDIIAAKGPLGGIYSALAHARYDRVFIIGADMPAIDPNILIELQKFDRYSCIVPRWRNGYLEPLCAIYTKRVMEQIKPLIDLEKLKISSLFSCLPENVVKWVDIDALILAERITPTCFFNINSPEDLQALIKAEQ